MNFHPIPLLVTLSLLLLTVLITPALAMDVYFGTSGNNAGQPAGVYVSKFDSATGELQRARLALELKGAGWIVEHPTLPILYSTGDIEDEASIVAIDIAGDQAIELNSQPTGGGKSCFVTPDQTGRLLISAQYGGSSVSVFPIAKNGTVGPRSQLFMHGPPSRVHKNQNAAHPHYVGISPDNRFAFVCDLGMDKIVTYSIDLETKQLKEVAQTAAIEGGGPRHMKFSADRKHALVLNELELSVSVFKYDAESGQLSMVGSTEALSDDEKALNTFNSASEIRVHPSGRFVYSANRGHDSISVYDFDVASGKLERKGLMSVRGSWPRNFNLSPAGDFLLAAGQHSNTVSVFAVDQESGALQFVQRSSTFVPGPICVLFRK